jgi:HSP20 family molecular chaperone IbpA
MRLTNFLSTGAKRSSRVCKEFCKPWTRVLGKRTSHRGETFSPPVDVFETDNELCVFVDLPGLKSADLEISLQEGTLLLKGTRQKEWTTDWTFYCKERPYGTFQRTILLPDLSLDADAMEVKLDRGVLRVTIPKNDSAEVVPQFLFPVSCNRSSSAHMALAH